MIKSIRTYRGYVRRGFTLMELMVAVGILLGVMVMIGTVFSTATKAGGQATATSTIYRQLGQVVDVMESDLEAMEPSTRVMALARVDVLAAESERDRQFRPHRADVLMLFTQRDIDPYVFRQPAPPKPEVSLDSVVQVVYGHANIGRLKSAGIYEPNSVKYVEGRQGSGRSDILASQWHLARRVVLFPELRYTGPLLPGMGPQSGPVNLINSEILTGAVDVFVNSFNDAVTPDPNRLQPWIPPGYFEFTGTTSNYFYVAFENSLFYSAYGSAQYRYSTNLPLEPFPILTSDGTNWYSYRSGTMWERVGPSGPMPPYTAPAPPLPNFTSSGVLGQLFYNGWDTRTVLDPRPPAQYPEAMAAYFLPACSDFRVEYTYDDPREIAVDPSTGPVQPVRWHSPQRGQTLVWSRLSAGGSSYGGDLVKSRTDPHRWPRALRITMKVWDQGDRLTEPVTRTIIHTWD